MQDEMECDWFKPSNRNPFAIFNFQLPTSQQNLNLIPTKNRNKNNCTFDNCKQNARNTQWNAFKMKKKT